MRLWYLNCNLKVLFSVSRLTMCKATSISEGSIPFGIRILRFLSNSDLTIPLAFWKDIRPLVFKWLKQYYGQQ